MKGSTLIAWHIGWLESNVMVIVGCCTTGNHSSWQSTIVPVMCYLWWFVNDIASAFRTKLTVIATAKYSTKFTKAVSYDSYTYGC